MKAVVDKETCTGCGLCVNTCPEVFDMEGDVATVKANDVPEAARECAKQAEIDCPVEAIKITE